MDDSVYSAVDLIPPGAPADAQSIAYFLQDQLDTINKEIKFVFLFVALCKTGYIGCF